MTNTTEIKVGSAVRIPGRYNLKAIWYVRAIGRRTLTLTATPDEAYKLGFIVLASEAVLVAS